MKLNKLLDMKLRDVLDEYCAVYNSECVYYYRIFRWDDVFKCYDVLERMMEILALVKNKGGKY